MKGKTNVRFKTVDDDYSPEKLKVDLSKFKVGDYVTVRTRIRAFAGPTADALPITIDPNPWANEIIGHEPTE